MSNVTRRSRGPHQFRITSNASALPSGANRTSGHPLGGVLPSRLQRGRAEACVDRTVRSASPSVIVGRPLSEHAIGMVLTARMRPRNILLVSFKASRSQIWLRRHGRIRAREATPSPSPLVLKTAIEVCGAQSSAAATSPSMFTALCRIADADASPPPPVIRSPGRAMRPLRRWSSGGLLVIVVPAGQTTGCPESRTHPRSGSSSRVPRMSAFSSSLLPSVDRVRKPSADGFSEASRSQPHARAIAASAITRACFISTSHYASAGRFVTRCLLRL